MYDFQRPKMLHYRRTLALRQRPVPRQPSSPRITPIKHFISIDTHPSPILSLGPSETYGVLGVELNTSLTITKQIQELKRTTTSVINALSTLMLTQSRRMRVIRGLLIGQGRRKNASLRSSTVPTRPMLIPVRDISCSSRRNSPPSLVFPPPSGDGKRK
jgi:hypothetical protein